MAAQQLVVDRRLTLPRLTNVYPQGGMYDDSSGRSDVE